jgi:glutamate-1-semialdehyde 2,1-aminomutase
MRELTPDVYAELNRKGGQVTELLTEVFASHGLDVQVNGAGSMFALHFTNQPVTDYRTKAAADQKRARELFLSLVNHGVLIAPRAMGALSTPMDEDDIQQFVDAVDAAVSELKPRWEAAEPQASR